MNNPQNTKENQVRKPTENTNELSLNVPRILQVDEKKEEQEEKKETVEEEFTLYKGEIYNSKGYKICGFLNQHNKPCQRIGKCPFHHGKTRDENDLPKGIKFKKSEEIIKKKPYKRGWSKDEHFRFLTGLQIHGKGSWKEISNIVKTRTPIQIQSHAQKYFQRQKQNKKSKKSIHDFTLDDLKDRTNQQLLEQSRVNENTDFKPNPFAQTQNPPLDLTGFLPYFSNSIMDKPAENPPEFANQIMVNYPNQPNSQQPNRTTPPNVPNQVNQNRIQGQTNVIPPPQPRNLPKRTQNVPQLLNYQQISQQNRQSNQISSGGAQKQIPGFNQITQLQPIGQIPAMQVLPQPKEPIGGTTENGIKQNKNDLIGKKRKREDNKGQDQQGNEETYPNNKRIKNF